MDQRYRVSVAPPGPTLSVHIESARTTRRAFDATLKLAPPAVPRSACGAAQRTLPLIYGHAVALRAKGVRRP